MVMVVVGKDEERWELYRENSFGRERTEMNWKANRKKNMVAETLLVTKKMLGILINTLWGWL